MALARLKNLLQGSRFGRIAAVIGVLSLVISGSQAVSAATRYSATTYTLKNLAATVSGTSVSATATVAASVKTTAQYAGICVRDANNNNHDFNKAQNVVLTTTGTALKGSSQTLAAGTYTYFACIEVQYVWTQVGSNKSFTIGTTGTGGGGTTTCYTQTWAQGSSGQCVKDIQNLLNYDVYQTNTSQYLVVDGDYGSYTAAAVKLEQNNNGLTQSGTVDAQTWPYVCTPGSGTVPSWYTSAATDAGCPPTVTPPAPVTYTLDSLAATVNGTSVSATATVAASADTTAQTAGICVRDASNGNFDFSMGQNVVLTTTGTVLNGAAQTLASGTYTYYACITVQNVASQVGNSQTFTVSDTSGGGTTSTLPYASALSGYTNLAQSYTASDMISGNWAQKANDTKEGGATCATSNVTYDATNDAVKLTTNGLPTNQSGASCGDIRSATTVPTKNSVIESKIWLPGTSSTSMLDWASFWTDGTDANGVENWPVTGEVDAVETQYGQSYVSTHCGCMPDYNPANFGPTENWTTEPAGWEDQDTTYATTSAPNVQPGWNVVDIAFNADGSAGIYYNGTLYVTVPASALAWNTGYTYINWGISGAYDTFSQSSWPTGPGYEEVQYLKVFTP